MNTLNDNHVPPKSFYAFKSVFNFQSFCDKILEIQIYAFQMVHTMNECLLLSKK